MPVFDNLEPPSNHREIARLVIRFALVLLFVLVAIQSLVTVGAPRAPITLLQGIVDCALCLLIALGIAWV